MIALRRGGMDNGIKQLRTMVSGVKIAIRGSGDASFCYPTTHSARGPPLSVEPR